MVRGALIDVPCAGGIRSEQCFPSRYTVFSENILLYQSPRRLDKSSNVLTLHSVSFKSVDYIAQPLRGNFNYCIPTLNHGWRRQEARQYLQTQRSRIT